MKHPIQYALTYPHRRGVAGDFLDLGNLGKLEFMQPNLKKFPCLDLAYKAAREQGALPCALNAADEVAVDFFLSGKIPFMTIPQVVERMLEFAKGESNFSSVQELLRYDQRIRKECRRLIELEHLTYEKAIAN
jgi:1-deoxy-D-xylulose-5-phosphate reductoisomerase